MAQPKKAKAAEKSQQQEQDSTRKQVRWFRAEAGSRLAQIAGWLESTQGSKVAIAEAVEKCFLPLLVLDQFDQNATNGRSGELVPLFPGVTDISQLNWRDQIALESDLHQSIAWVEQQLDLLRWVYDRIFSPETASLLPKRTSRTASQSPAVSATAPSVVPTPPVQVQAQAQPQPAAAEPPTAPVQAQPAYPSPAYPPAGYAGQPYSYPPPSMPIPPQQYGRVDQAHLHYAHQPLVNYPSVGYGGYPPQAPVYLVRQEIAPPTPQQSGHQNQAHLIQQQPIHQQTTAYPASYSPPVQSSPEVEAYYEQQRVQQQTAYQNHQPQALQSLQSLQSQSTQTQLIQPQPVQSPPTQTQPIQSQLLQSHSIQSQPIQPPPIQRELVQSQPTQTQPIQSQPIQPKPQAISSQLPDPIAQEQLVYANGASGNGQPPTQVVVLPSQSNQQTLSKQDLADSSNQVPDIPNLDPMPIVVDLNRSFINQSFVGDDEDPPFDNIAIGGIDGEG